MGLFPSIGKRDPRKKGGDVGSYLLNSHLGPCRRGDPMIEDRRALRRAHRASRHMGLERGGKGLSELEQRIYNGLLATTPSPETETTIDR